MVATIKAAGCVVYRVSDKGNLKFLIIHRPYYDDWTLPKGKQDAGETDKETAIREVQEETGIVGELGKKVTEIHYDTSKGKPKVVVYYSMEATNEVSGVPNDEVDETRWVSLKKAQRTLSFYNDVAVVEAFVRQRDKAAKQAKS